ncbi:MAG TPA: DUF6152 family protein [Bryobacteraceae bacterium]|nr:DUF6152 family protein [Bryobacteraceae bacterium]
MRNLRRAALALGAGLLLLAGLSWGHHGSAISYDTAHLWTTWATVTEFNYLNPHPSMTFDRVTKDGKTEHWVAELLTNPSELVRAGWTKSRSVEALKPGTRVKLYIGTSRAGGFSGIIMKLENEQGENIVGTRTNATGVDMDGVPGGLQPSGADKLPGQEN